MAATAALPAPETVGEAEQTVGQLLLGGLFPPVADETSVHEIAVRQQVGTVEASKIHLGATTVAVLLREPVHVLPPCVSRCVNFSPCNCPKREWLMVDYPSQFISENRGKQGKRQEHNQGGRKLENPRFSGISSCFLMEVGSGVEPLYVDLQST